jgi:hypothetical protein
VAKRSIEVEAGEIEIETSGELIVLSMFGLTDDVEMTVEQARQLVEELLATIVEVESETD